MTQIQTNPLISEKCPQLKLGILTASVIIEKDNPELWTKIDETIAVKQRMPMDQIKHIPEIATSREAYKALGKEPSRYRLSAEALHRRIIKGLGLYRINNVVDCINLISLKTGYSIGGYDADKINGNILLDFGKADDIYEAIGRGILNIEHLPVFRDEHGAFGSPTSDSTRTMINDKTTKILLVFLNFGNHDSLIAAMEAMKDLLTHHAAASNIEIKIS